MMIVRPDQGFYIVAMVEDFHQKVFVVGRDKTCSCGVRNCPHVRAVRAYLLAGGRKADGVLWDDAWLKPNNDEVEEALLGALLVYPGQIGKVKPIVAPDDFFIVKNGWVYEALLSLHAEGEGIDLILVRERLAQLSRPVERGYLARLVGEVQVSAHAEAYARIVKGTALRRRIIEMSTRFVQWAASDDSGINAVLDDIDQTMQALKESAAPLEKGN